MDEQVAQAYLKRIRVSPRKLNLLAQLVRGLPVRKAVQHLAFSRKRSALDVKKTLLSAMANAENNNNMDIDSLYVREAYVEPALVLKRMHPRAKGRGVGIKKRFSSIRIIVAEKKA